MAKLSFDKVKAGDEVPPVRKTMTQDIINKWAEISLDFNPLHVDVEYAKTTRFGGTIAHGYIALSYLNEMMTNWLGDGWIRGGKFVGIQYKAPVRPGDILTAKGRVIGRKEEGTKKEVECEIYIENQKGEKPIVGKATGLVRES